MSDSDLKAGRNWRSDLQGHLEESGAGIVVVTADNRDKPWLMFEAGALAKQVNNCLIPYLVDVDSSALSRNALDMFQTVKADREGTQKMVERIFEAGGGKQEDQTAILKSFAALWPDLEKPLTEARNHPPQDKPVDERVLLERIAAGVKRIEDQLFGNQSAGSKPTAGGPLPGIPTTATLADIFQSSLFSPSQMDAIRSATSPLLAALQRTPGLSAPELPKDAKTMAHKRNRGDIKGPDTDD